MGGVDKSDQMIGNKAHRRTSQFWKTLFYHMLDIARVDYYIVFQKFRSLDKNKNVEKHYKGLNLIHNLMP